MKSSFITWHENTSVRVQVRRIELLHNNPTFRIEMEGEFLGYLERSAPTNYRTLTNNTIPSNILSASIKAIEQMESEQISG